MRDTFVVPSGIDSLQGFVLFRNLQPKHQPDKITKTRLLWVYQLIALKRTQSSYIWFDCLG